MCLDSEEGVLYLLGQYFEQSTSALIDLSTDADEPVNVKYIIFLCLLINAVSLELSWYFPFLPYRLTSTATQSVRVRGLSSPATLTGTTGPNSSLTTRYSILLFCYLYLLCRCVLTRAPRLCMCLEGGSYQSEL